MSELEQRLIAEQNKIIQQYRDFTSLLQNPPIKTMAKRQRRKLTLSERIKGWVNEDLVEIKGGSNERLR